MILATCAWFECFAFVFPLLKDFGSIFSTLLPGTSAKLSPPEGMSELQGLEIKVAFGDVWKESLTELSGGQRSVLVWLHLKLCHK